MRFYKNQHQYYCGIDLHAKQMYICILDKDGNKRLHKEIQCDPQAFLATIKPYREEIVVGVEGMFCWYWIADLCRDEGIPFVLGHALYMKAVHGAKTKNDKVDSERIAMLLRSGMFPEAYVYPREMRATRDLMRRRLFLVRKRAELLSHITMTHQQYNAPLPTKSLGYKKNRDNVEAKFIDPSLKRMLQSDSHLVDIYTKEIAQLEHFILKEAQKTQSNSFALSLLRSIPGIGPVLSLTLLYEIHSSDRFPTVQQFCSYARLVKPERTSCGNPTGGGGSKIGNQHLKWAFSEAVVSLLRNVDDAKRYYERLQRKHPKKKALSIMAHRLGIGVYFMLQRKEAFSQEKFFQRQNKAPLREPGWRQDSRTASPTGAAV